jgi:hypothetical protein
MLPRCTMFLKSIFVGTEVGAAGAQLTPGRGARADHGGAQRGGAAVGRVSRLAALRGAAPAPAAPTLLPESGWSAPGLCTANNPRGARTAVLQPPAQREGDRELAAPGDRNGPRPSLWPFAPLVYTSLILTEYRLSDASVRGEEGRVQLVLGEGRGVST